ncbi:hypothetical protein ACFY78_10765 [Streptomyces olindensis]|uniref:hypothetical protein n=1 Tax=Streptomyces olindensis TaxID=358823 RepID=UPI003687F474
MLRACPDGSRKAQALVWDLLDAIAVSDFRLLPPRALRYFEAPARCDGEAASFFLGGVTGCPDWQRRAVLQLDAIGSPAVVLNPRRESLPVGQVEAARGTGRVGVRAPADR